MVEINHSVEGRSSLLTRWQTIPGEDLPAKWDFHYFFEVMDTKGNGKIYPDLEKETPYIVVKLQR